MIEHTIERLAVKPGRADTIQACAITIDRADLAGRALAVFDAAIRKARELLGTTELKLLQSMFGSTFIVFWVGKKGD